MARLCGNQLPSMNRIWPVVVSLVLLVGGGCQPEGATPSASGSSAPAAKSAAVAKTVPAIQPLLQWHSLGLQSVAHATEGKRLQAILSEPKSGLLKSNTLERLSVNLPALLFPEAGTNATQATRLKPLLEDVLNYESKVVWVSQSPLRWRVEVKIPEDRTGVWSIGLYDLLVRGEQTNKIARTNITGTVTSVSYSSTESYRFGLAKGWVSVERAESGFDWSSVSVKGLESAKDAWLSLAMDTKLMPNATAAFGEGNLPYARLAIEGKGDNQSSALDLKFPNALNIKLQDWQVPTNTIKDPVISFTAVQGFGGWWGRQEWLKPFGLKEAPQQGYFWAQPEAPYQSFGIFKAKDATNVIASAVSRTNEFNAAATNIFFGRMIARPNELLWGGLPPFVIPSFKAAPEPADDQVLMALFPMARSKTDLPPELLKQFIGQPKLVYYDWEITELRLKQWMQMGPFISMILKRMPLTNSKIPYEWLGAISPKLGNSVTEGDWATPDEIHIRRKSPIGLTGAELYLFARWLDQKSFPLWDAPVDPMAKLPGVPMAPPAPGK